MKVCFDPAFVGILSSSRLPTGRRAEQISSAAEMTAAGLARQLEGRWSGIGGLSEPRRRAFMQLADHMRGIGAEKSALEFHLGMRSIGGFDEELVEECALSHAYGATITIAMIARVKASNGILQSSDFFWARSADPAFWLMINGYGRPRHDPRIVGAFVHYAAEKRGGGPLSKTYFDISSVEIRGETVLEADPVRLEEFRSNPGLFL